MKLRLVVLTIFLLSSCLGNIIMRDFDEEASERHSQKSERESDSNQNSRLCKNKCRQPGEKCVIGVGNTVTCQTVCGDKLTAGSEQCDDGNTNNGDGCSNTCQVEYDWSCAGQPSVCTNLCGNFKWDSGEQCQYTFMFDCSSTCHKKIGMKQACISYSPTQNPPPYYNSVVDETFVCKDPFGFGCENCLKISPNFKCGFLDSAKPTNYFCGLTCPATSSKSYLGGNDAVWLFSLFLDLAEGKPTQLADFIKIISVKQMINFLKANNLYQQIAYNGITIDPNSPDQLRQLTILGFFFLVQGIQVFGQTLTTSKKGMHTISIKYPNQSGSYFNKLADYVNKNQVLTDPNAASQLPSIQSVLSCLKIKMVPVDPSTLV